MSAPLTYDDLAIAERDLMEGTGHERLNAGLRLLNEVRRLRVEHAADVVVIEAYEATIRLLEPENERLRSDEWLRAAIVEMTAEPRMTFLDILRKHRDAR